MVSNLRKNEISGTSNTINKFEENLADYFDRKYAIAVSNGTVALELAVKQLDLKKGDEVIVPSFTIISCLSAVVRSEATPIFCDVDLDCINITRSLSENLGLLSQHFQGEGVNLVVFRR